MYIAPLRFGQKIGGVLLYRWDPWANGGQPGVPLSPCVSSNPSLASLFTNTLTLLSYRYASPLPTVGGVSLGCSTKHLYPQPTTCLKPTKRGAKRTRICHSGRVSLTHIVYRAPHSPRLCCVPTVFQQHPNSHQSMGVLVSGRGPFPCVRSPISWPLRQTTTSRPVWQNR